MFISCVSKIAFRNWLGSPFLCFDRDNVIKIWIDHSLPAISISSFKNVSIFNDFNSVFRIIWNFFCCYILSLPTPKVKPMLTWTPNFNFNGWPITNSSTNTLSDTGICSFPIVNIRLICCLTRLVRIKNWSTIRFILLSQKGLLPD